MQLEIVIGDNSVTLATDFGVNSSGTPEQDHGLIDQVRTQVEQDAGAGERLVPPRPWFGRRSKAVEAAFELDEPPEKFLVEDLFHGQKITVPAAVLKCAQHTVPGARQLYEFVGVV